MIGETTEIRTKASPQVSAPRPPASGGCSPVYGAGTYFAYEGTDVDQVTFTPTVTIEQGGFAHIEAWLCGRSSPTAGNYTHKIQINDLNGDYASETSMITGQNVYYSLETQANFEVPAGEVTLSFEVDSSQHPDGAMQFGWILVIGNEG